MTLWGTCMSGVKIGMDIIRMKYLFRNLKTLKGLCRVLRRVLRAVAGKV